MQAFTALATPLTVNVFGLLAMFIPLGANVRIGTGTFAMEIKG
jgi:hypothetical protein